MDDYVDFDDYTGVDRVGVDAVEGSFPVSCLGGLRGCSRLWGRPPPGSMTVHDDPLYYYSTYPPCFTSSLFRTLNSYTP